MLDKHKREHILSKLRELDSLFDAPDKWTKEAWARNKDNVKVNPTDTLASKWCLLGGCIAVANSRTAEDLLHGREHPFLMSDELKKTADIDHITNFNDNTRTTFEDIKDLISRTISRLERD